MPLSIPRKVVPILTALLCGATSLASAQGTLRFIKDKAIACRSRSDSEEFERYALAKDVGAAKQMLDDGSCVVLRAGVPVYLEDPADNSMRVRIRPRGSRARLWTLRLSITSE